jgi:hypothetical protein
LGYARAWLSRWLWYHVLVLGVASCRELLQLFHPEIERHRREATNPLTPIILLRPVAFWRISSQAALHG